MLKTCCMLSFKRTDFSLEDLGFGHLKHDINHNSLLFWRHVWLMENSTSFWVARFGTAGGCERLPRKVSVKNMHNPFVFLVSHSSLLVSLFLHPRKIGEGWVPTRQAAASAGSDRAGRQAQHAHGHVCVGLGNGTCWNRAQERGKRSWDLKARAGIPHPEVVSRENVIASWNTVGFAAVYSSLSSVCLF